MLNQIISELPPEHPASDTERLKDAIGHTPVQVVVGGAVGLCTAYVVFTLAVFFASLGAGTGAPGAPAGPGPSAMVAGAGAGGTAAHGVGSSRVFG